MHLSIDPLFCISLSPNDPFFTTFHPMAPYFYFFQSKFSFENYQILKNFAYRSENLKEKLLKLLELCVISHSMSPLLQVCHPMTLFCKKIITDSPLIWCIGRHIPITFICKCPPPTHIFSHKLKQCACILTLPLKTCSYITCSLEVE